MVLGSLPFPLRWAVLGVWVMSGLVAAAFLLLLLSKALREFAAAYRVRRRKVFAAALDALIMEAPGDYARLLAPWRWGDAAIVEEMLIEAFGMIHGPLRERVARTAEEIGLVDRHIARLASRDPHRRAEAVERLGLLRSRKALPALLEVLEGPETALQLLAARALGRIGAAEALPRLLEALARWRGPKGNPIAQAIAAFGEAAVGPLVGALSPESPIRARAADILGEIRSPAALPALVGILSSDKDPEARAAAATALGRSAHPDALPALMKGLQDIFREVRARSAWALGQVGDPFVCPALEKALLEDGYWWVRVRAAEALSRLGPTGQEILRRHQAGPDPALRSLSGEMLSLAGRAP